MHGLVRDKAGAFFYTKGSIHDILAFAPLDKLENQTYCVKKGTKRTKRTKRTKMSETDAGFIAAVEEARQGFEEGGVPIGRSPQKGTNWC